MRERKKMRRKNKSKGDNKPILKNKPAFGFYFLFSLFWCPIAQSRARISINNKKKKKSCKHELKKEKKNILRILSCMQGLPDVLRGWKCLNSYYLGRKGRKMGYFWDHDCQNICQARSWISDICVCVSEELEQLPNIGMIIRVGHKCLA